MQNKVRNKIKFNKTFICPQCGRKVYIPKLYDSILREFYQKRKELHKPLYAGVEIKLQGECQGCGSKIVYKVECHQNDNIGFSVYIKNVTLRKGASQMEQTTIENINLDKIGTANTFSSLMGTVPNDITAFSGCYVVNAKSILGLLSLDLSKPISIKIDGEVPQEFVEKVERFKEAI